MGETVAKDKSYAVIDESEYKRLCDDITASTVVVPSVYQEVFLDKYRYFILSSGRLSGKTSILVGLWWATVNKFPRPRHCCFAGYRYGNKGQHNKRD